MREGRCASVVAECVAVKLDLKSLFSRVWPPQGLSAATRSSFFDSFLLREWPQVERASARHTQSTRSSTTNSTHQRPCAALLKLLILSPIHSITSERATTRPNGQAKQLDHHRQKQISSPHAMDAFSAPSSAAYPTSSLQTANFSMPGSGSGPAGSENTLESSSAVAATQSVLPHPPQPLASPPAAGGHTNLMSGLHASLAMASSGAAASAGLSNRSSVSPPQFAPTPGGTGMTSLYGRLRTQAVQQQQPALATSAEQSSYGQLPSLTVAGSTSALYGSRNQQQQLLFPASAHASNTSNSSGGTCSLLLCGDLKPQTAAPALQYSLFSISIMTNSHYTKSSHAGDSTCSRSTSASSTAQGYDSSFTAFNAAATPALVVGNSAAADTSNAQDQDALLSLLLSTTASNCGSEAAALSRPAPLHPIASSQSILSPTTGSATSAAAAAADDANQAGVLQQLQQLYINEQAAGMGSNSMNASSIADTSFDSPATQQQQLLMQQLKSLQQAQAMNSKGSSSNHNSALDDPFSSSGLNTAMPDPLAPPEVFAAQMMGAAAAGGGASSLQLPGLGIAAQGGGLLGAQLPSQQQAPSSQQLALAQLLAQLNPAADCISYNNTYGNSNVYSNSASMHSSGPSAVSDALAALRHKMLLGSRALCNSSMSSGNSVSGSSQQISSLYGALSASAGVDAPGMSGSGGLVLVGGKQSLGQVAGPGCNPMYKVIRVG